MKHIDSVLYVDTDTLFLSPVSDIWNFFSKFNSTQIAGLSPEHEDRNVGWYNRFAKHPFYGPLGLNSGVMLMNLTRMRKFKWEEYILPLYKEFKLKITWGDQDLINILFYYHPGEFITFELFLKFSSITPPFLFNFFIFVRFFVSSKIFSPWSDVINGKHFLFIEVEEIAQQFLYYDQ